MTPEQRQHAILEALYKRKNKPETDVETIRQESCGSVAPSVFMSDWKILLDNGFVVGLPTNDNNKIITGMGRITSRGEQEFKALKAAWDKTQK
jgi:DNA-binding PadR family transcriptional regulator